MMLESGDIDNINKIFLYQLNLNAGGNKKYGQDVIVAYNISRDNIYTNSNGIVNESLIIIGINIILKTIL